MSDEALASELVNRSAADYPGGSTAFQRDLQAQYELFVRETHEYWKQLEPQNRFFVSANGLLLTGAGYLVVSGLEPPLPIVGVFLLIGLVLTVQWSRIIQRVQHLNRVRHEIIQELERSLPAAPYTEEFRRLSAEAPRLSIQGLYRVLPLIFALAYGAVGFLLAAA